MQLPAFLQVFKQTWFVVADAIKNASISEYKAALTARSKTISVSTPVILLIWCERERLLSGCHAVDNI